MSRADVDEGGKQQFADFRGVEWTIPVLIRVHAWRRFVIRLLDAFAVGLAVAGEDLERETGLEPVTLCLGRIGRGLVAH